MGFTFRNKYFDSYPNITISALHEQCVKLNQPCPPSRLAPIQLVLRQHTFKTLGLQQHRCEVTVSLVQLTKHYRPQPVCFYTKHAWLIKHTSTCTPTKAHKAPPFLYSHLLFVCCPQHVMILLAVSLVNRQPLLLQEQHIMWAAAPNLCLYAMPLLHIIIHRPDLLCYLWTHLGSLHLRLDQFDWDKPFFRTSIHYSPLPNPPTCC